MGSSASIITFLTITNVVYAKIPPSKGDATQLITILVTTSQSTWSGATYIPIPRIPPTIL